MSRFNNNRGGFGMNQFQPRRVGGPGGPMRGGLMGNPHYRNHPFQNANQNRRGGNNNSGNFVMSSNQSIPQKVEQIQSKPIIPPPSPGPALTMKGPMEQQKPSAQQEQQKPTPPADQAKTQASTPKPATTPAQPSNQANQSQQTKSPAGNPNAQQQQKPQQPPQQSPKPIPLPGQKPAPQQSPKPTPQQSPKPAPQQSPKPTPQQGPKPGPQQNQNQRPNPQQNQRPNPQQNQRPNPQQNQRPVPQQNQRPVPQQNQRPGPQQNQRPNPQQNQRPGPQQNQQSGPLQASRPGQQQGQRSGPQQGQRSGPQQAQGVGPKPNQGAEPVAEQKPREEPSKSEAENAGVFKAAMSMLLKPGEKSYTQRCRLFVGNLPNDISEEDFRKLFAKYGEPSEVFVNKGKGFGFIRLESRSLAEIAKAEMDDYPMKGRPLRVRFATHAAALSVKNLSPFVSNELLEDAFSQFGVIERSVVVVDDRGRSTGRGIIEFASRAAAKKALDRCNDGVFLLTASPRPVVVEPLEQFDCDDGLPEKFVQKNQKFQAAREHPPRFPRPGSFEFEYSKRWKSLDEMEKQQREQVEKNMREAREKLESEMEDAYHEHQANMLRQELLRRQEELRRMEELHNQEMQKRKEMQLRQEEERRRREEELLRKREMEEQMRRQREEGYRMGNYMDRDVDIRMHTSGSLGIGEMAFSGSSQSFAISGLGFESPSGLGSSPGALMGSEMICYEVPIADCTSSSGTKSRKSIWIIGDGYVRRSAQRAAETIGGNLCLPDVRVSWFGKGGLRWEGLLPFFSDSLRGRTAPDILIINCGGNDMGVVSSVKLVSKMKEDLQQLQLLHPRMSIIFSSITQRGRWTAGTNPAKIEKARRFVNNVMTAFISSLNGANVEHPHIRHSNPEIFLPDKVNFTNRGNDMFLANIANTLKGHLQKQ